MVERAKVRASGETVASETAKEVAATAEDPIEAHLPEETARKHRTPGFARMRTSWRPDDHQIVQRAKAAVDGMILANFADAYDVMNQVYDLVRTPEVDANGEVKRDQFGFTIWARTASGSYEEDFTRLNLRQKEHLLFLVTTRLFAWEQRAADAWGEAMFAKSIWEERFSIGFDEGMTGTVDDRKAAGTLASTEERYFAIFQSIYSRRADALVRSLSLLGQRIKDSLSG